MNALHQRASALPSRSIRPSLHPRVVRCNAVRQPEPFSENAAQVKRLINRDRKEFLGNADDILDKYQTEFGTIQNGGAKDEASASPAGTATATAANTVQATPKNPFSNIGGSSSGTSSLSGASPFGAPTPSSSNPFGAPSSSAANPFGSPAAPSRVKSSIEPAGLRPDMGPDPFTKEKPWNPLETITLTQVVLFFSFTTIIALMIGTCYFVFSVGGIRLNGV